MWTLLLTKLAPKSKWVFGLLGAAGLIAGSVAWYYSTINYHDSKGYNRAVKELTEEANLKIIEAANVAMKDAEKKIAETLERQRIIFDGELQRAKSEQTVNTILQEVIKNVETIKYVDNCGKLHDDSILQLNKSINTVNKSTSN